ncbi:MAG: hypothetical protein AUJ92_21285 [Armatimonadetes bacterium CG2_30_59_28]|nr:transglutaminase domain-containing protein [Armatimonadota bacterium]OIO89497.1 MAG: hypothetical protein AUJ92_21285 [Armatimonadetes bacterium CG2_30_59_28]PIU61635.1 MAG: hypothetical protein COS85_20545 [Armatimonadetes bacterium CG07_land_8_20_14_0_80_59_28]PIX42593.1 MAG: hypothetical protein COZ56_08990 [Armatimonadetes bacterium CG_4_8_14_3_um_filter_58_9]PIY38305.1 MAG: hypothetical protein COZ05_20925 [Armatimonadetes bacterium CG_4_10_14_3_um_filter_59_10]PJB67312.1 MAG: hypothet
MKPSTRISATAKTPYFPPESSAFVASYLVTACGLTAVTSTVDDAGFSRTIFFLLTCGYVASFSAQMEHLWWGKMLRTVATVVGLGSIPLLSFFIAPTSIFPVEALAEQDLRTAVLLAWLAVILSFLVGSYVLHQWISLSFPIVPTVSMFGLIGHMNPNANVIVAFVAFVCFAIFLVSYENTLRKSPPGLWRADRIRTTTHQHILLAVGFFIPVMVSALALSSFLQWAVPPWFSQGLHRMRASMVESLPTSWTRFADTFTVTGGPTSLGGTTRMVVYSPHALKWRGQVYNRYDGGRWDQMGLDDAGTVRTHPRSGTVNFAPITPTACEEVTTQVKCVTSMPGILYAPGIPLSVKSENEMVELTEGNCLRTGRLAKGDRYSTRSAVLIPEKHSDELLTSPGTYPDELWEMYYVALPQKSLKVKQLAEQLARQSGAQTPYAKTLLFRDYLKDRCRYSLNSPRVPSGTDAAEFFILKSRRGACDMFATALAVMCRAVDVPARIVTGYAPGQQVEARRGESMKRFDVRDRDAHAWVEIYVNDAWGWVAVDPSEGVSETPDSFLQRLTSGYRWGQLLRFGRQNFLPLCATAFLLWSAFQLMRQPAQTRVVKRSRSFRLTDRRGRMCRIYSKMCHQLRRAGVQWSPASAPRELLEATGKSPALWDQREIFSLSAQIADRFAQACYSTRSVSGADLERARGELKSLAQRLRQLGKGRTKASATCRCPRFHRYN